MRRLDKSLTDAKTNADEITQAEKRQISTIQLIRKVVDPAINICNLDNDLYFIIDGYEISLPGDGLMIRVESLRYRGTNQPVSEETLDFHESKPFEEKAGKILTENLKVPVEVNIDYSFFRK